MPDKALDIPHHAPSISAQSADTHVRAEITPNDPKLAFDLLVPKSWAFSSELGPVTHMLFHAAALGFFTSAAESGAPVIAVTATPCPFDIPVDSFALLSLEREGWTVVASQWVPGPHGLFFELTATRVVNEVEHVRRTSMRVGQGAIIAVNCMCARQHWDAVKETFWAAHVTFALLRKGEPNLEHWLRARAEAPAFSTVHPASWQAEPTKSDNGRSGLQLRLIDAKGETLLAYLLVKAEPNPFPKPLPLSELWSAARRMLEAAGISITTTPQPIAAREDPRGEAVPGWLGGYIAPAKLGSADITLRVGFVDRGGLTFTLAACSPQLQDDTLVALRAQRAFEIARAGLDLPR